MTIRHLLSQEHIDGFVAGYHAGVDSADHKWHLMARRYPERDGEYLIFHPMYGVGVLHWFSATLIWGNSFGVEVLDVTHWMELPAPPV